MSAVECLRRPSSFPLVRLDAAPPSFPSTTGEPRPLVLPRSSNQTTVTHLCNRFFCSLLVPPQRLLVGCWIRDYEFAQISVRLSHLWNKGYVKTAGLTKNNRGLRSFLNDYERPTTSPVSMGGVEHVCIFDENFCQWMFILT
jgi:hypothetical protein